MKPYSLNRQILAVAVPSIISNITVPLLGLVDMTIVGHLGASAYIAAIALGGTLFNVIYWIFGFLRMGTGGLTSQAFGRNDRKDIAGLIVRSLSVALAISAVILVLHRLIIDFSFEYVFSTGSDVEQLARQYLYICIWGVPAVLGSYSFAGWFIGMQNSRIPMYVAVVQNIINIAASMCFVFVFGMKVEGVALGTLVAQYSGVLMFFCAWRKYYGEYSEYVRQTVVFESGSFKRFFMVNRDIFLRTLCLVAVTLFFTSAGASQGEQILAANALMMQFFTFFSYIMDGFAYAGEALAGKYTGARDSVMLKKTVSLLFKWGIAVAVVFIVLYAAGGEMFMGVMTDDTDVLAVSSSYFHWVLLIPVAGFAAFVWDGIYIGATATGYMLLSMFIASAVFFVLYYTTSATFGNDSLWGAFIAYLAVRGGMQMCLANRAIYK